MWRVVILVAAEFYLCFLSYRLGYKQAQLDSLQKEVRYEQKVSTQKAVIYSRPNASRTELLRLFESGKM